MELKNAETRMIIIYSVSSWLLFSAKFIWDINGISWVGYQAYKGQEHSLVDEFVVYVWEKGKEESWTEWKPNIRPVMTSSRLWLYSHFRTFCSGWTLHRFMMVFVSRSRCAWMARDTITWRDPWSNMPMKVYKPCGALGPYEYVAPASPGWKRPCT